MPRAVMTTVLKEMSSLWQSEFVQLCGIDRCREKNGGCEHLCANTQGSYYCQCQPGYNRLFSKFNCENIDECVESPRSSPCGPSPQQQQRSEDGR
ncbi:Signal peptide, CUB and EGF-like domain-containing protein 3 [Portunus trituberculatus]|uniref:Signal peptide, CUB and EGF-like domain-containing protein 3 n=1 Tax=Portunus trituberculatus TaxID=210409 RepID=A0A5B7DA72_PORTR|nr:Signal peptide, CUB and EGF-like domain-containing protein 3 [Portunus trituberculatus]